jgi:hypothetical protein
MPVPLDEYPIHQAPLSMRYVESSDRNFYDRCYFNAHDRSGEVFLITGLGVYPNLGVTDAYALVRRGDTQHSVRCSEPLGDERLAQKVGPYRIEVVRPLEELRLVLDAERHGIGFDLTWHSSFPALDEPRHINHSAARVVLDGCRFAQLGTWSGSLRVDGHDYQVDPARWVGSRDRSWGIRPVGEAEPQGRAVSREGFWWLYAPIRFDEYALVVIVQEGADGYRSLNEAARVWPDGRIEQLGWPRFDIRYRPGTRHPESATIHLTDAAGKDVTVEVETLGSAVLHVGAGYGADPDWSHGLWKGEGFIESATYDMQAPDIAARTPFGVIDHVARARCEGAEGYGLFEHASVGRHDPTGFADFTSVAP